MKEIIRGLGAQGSRVALAMVAVSGLLVFWTQQSPLAGEGSGSSVGLRTLRVSVATPNPCWSVAISEVYRSDSGLLVVSELEPPPADVVCTQVVSTAEDEIKITAPGAPVRYFVLGRTWGWQADAPDAPSGTYVYPSSREELEPWLEGADRIR